MNSSRKAPTPEREGSVLQAKEQARRLVSHKNKHIKVYGQLCNASRVPSGIPTQKERYTCEVNPQANCISQK